MIVVDIGNTNVVIGIFINKKIKNILRFNTQDKKLKNKLNKFVSLSILNKLKLKDRVCIISSVSSYSTKDIINYFKLLNFNIFNINLKNISNKIKFHYVASELGADRIANTYAAIYKYGKNSLVIDFGTATTFDLIMNNNYMGGLIAPGINISNEALINNASKLKKFPIIKTKKFIGNNTRISIQSGFYWGYVSLINGIIKKIIIDKNINPDIILTGGLAHIFKKEIKFKTYIEPNLTLEGLYLIGQEKYA